MLMLTFSVSCTVVIPPKSIFFKKSFQFYTDCIFFIISPTLRIFQTWLAKGFALMFYTTFFLWNYLSLSNIYWIFNQLHSVEENIHICLIVVIAALSWHRKVLLIVIQWTVLCWRILKSCSLYLLSFFLSFDTQSADKMRAFIVLKSWSSGYEDFIWQRKKNEKRTQCTCVCLMHLEDVTVNLVH